jgi:hypothetical protein
LEGDFAGDGFRAQSPRFLQVESAESRRNGKKQDSSQDQIPGGNHAMGGRWESEQIL